MKKFDFANFIGRILVSLYFMINSLQFFWMTHLVGVEHMGIGFWLGVAVLEFTAGAMLLAGVKPRVGAAVLGFFILIKIIVATSGVANSAWEQWEIYHQIPDVLNAANAADIDFPKWASYHAQFIFSKLAILGACLFMLGTRTIPHSVFARSESNLRNKYGA